MSNDILPFYLFCSTAGGKEGGDDGSSSASLLVTLELNNTVFQGVLFAKPISSSSPAR